MDLSELDDISNFLAMTHPTTQDPQDQKPTTSLSSEQPELILETISCESPSRNLQDQLDHSKTDQQSVDPSKPLSTEQPSQRQTRTRTQSYLDAVRHEQGFLDDNLPPRSSTVVASSSQHILATALRRDISSNDSLSLNAITIAFSILPIRNRDTPSWLFTLPSPSIPPMKHRPAHRKSHQPMCPAAVDHMLFSPDGTHLVICSHTSSAHDGLGHLRLSILIQASSRADEWRLAWDEVVCDFSVRSVHDSSPLEPHTKRVLSARFIAQPRRWHTEPMSSETKLPADQVSMIKGTRYHKMKKPRGSAINYYAQGKGQTVAMVLNTNELFVVHLPLPQSNLPPHVLLTSLSNSTLPTSPLKLTPTPASVRVDRKRTITHDSECPSQGPQPESVVSQIIQKVNESIPKKIGLGLSVQSTPFPLMDETNPSLHPSYAAPQNLNIDRSLTPLFANTTPVQNGLETANPNGELVYDFNANNYSQFDLSMNSFISARKEIKTATIGFPIASKDAEDKFEEPRFLIAFQSKIKPIIPTPIKQIVLPASSSDFKSQLEDANQIGGSQFSITEDDLGNYITGLGDLDDAFDTPLDQAYPNTTQNSTSDNRKEIHEISMGEDGKTEESISIGRKRKRRQELLELQKKRRRYEPIAGIDESGAKDGTGDQASYGLIELAEVFVDFEDGMIPTIAIQPLSSIPVLDPFEHNGDCRITIRNLNFLELEHISSLSETTGHPAIRLLATYSRETIFGQGTDDNATIDELQCWEAYYERSCLSNGFLSLECFSENQRADKANLDQLTGPEEWAFIRSASKTLGLNQNVCNVISDWACQLGSFLVFVKSADPSHNLTACECLVFNSKDLSISSVTFLPSLEDLEAKRATLSSHGVWCYSVNAAGKVRALPLITSSQNCEVVALVMGAIYNREPLDDIARLINYRMRALVDGQSDKESSHFNLQWIFEQISGFFVTPVKSYKYFDLDPFLPPAWSFGYDLWCATPGYEKAAEIALIGRQLGSALSLGMSLRQESYTRSIWQMIGIIKWYVRLCQKIIRSAFPGSKTSHLCLLPMTSSLFFYLFKMIGLIGSFTKWLSEMGSTNFSLIPVDKSSCLASSPLVSLKDEIEIAKLVFKEIWEDDQKSLLSAELWFIILQDIGRIIIPSSDIDHGSSSNRHSEFFSAPLAATHADQVKESADHFRKVLEKYIKLDVQQGLSEVDEEVEGDDNKEVEKETEDEEIMEYDLINGGLKIDTRVLKFRKNIKKKTVRGEADEEQLKIKLEKEYIKKNYRQCVKCRCKSKIIYNKFKNKSENSLIEKNNPNLKSIDFECKSKNEAFKFNSQHLGQFQNEGTGANIAALEEGNSEGFDGWSFSAFDLSAREFERRCICFGAWVSI